MLPITLASRNAHSRYGIWSLEPSFLILAEKRESTHPEKAQIIYRGIPCTPQRWQDKECIHCGVFPLCIFFYLFTFYVRVYFIFFIYVVFYCDVWYYMLPFAVYFLHVEDI